MTSQAMRLLRLDAGSAVERLRGRRETMLRAFSAHRDRRALLDPVRSTLDGLDAQGWRELPAGVLGAAWRFNEALDGWRWYARYTEDMPGTVGTMLDAHHREIEAAWAALQVALTEAEAELPVRSAVPKAPGRAKTSSPEKRGAGRRAGRSPDGKKRGAEK